MVLDPKKIKAVTICNDRRRLLIVFWEAGKGQSPSWEDINRISSNRCGYSQRGLVPVLITWAQLRLNVPPGPEELWVLLYNLGQMSAGTPEITSSGPGLWVTNYGLFLTLSLHEPDLKVLFTNQLYLLRTESHLFLS